MESAATFRDWINSNKKAVVSYLYGKGYRSTNEILKNYRGEKDIYQVRKALRELKDEGKVDEKIRGVNTKYWRVVNTK